MTEPDRQWYEWIERWRQSGLSQAAFCREHGLVVSQFYYWRQRLEDAVEGFAEVVAEEPPPAEAAGAGGSGVRLRIGELVVEVDRDFDAATLRSVLAVAGC